MKKHCNKCNKDYYLDYFYLFGKYYDGMCKSCRNKYQREYRKKRPKAKYSKVYYDANKEIFKKARDKWYLVNRDKALKNNKQKGKQKTLKKNKIRKKENKLLYLQSLKTKNYINRLIYYRKMNGKTQKEIAIFLDISQSAYNKYEQGKIHLKTLTMTLLYLENKLTKEKKHAT